MSEDLERLEALRQSGVLTDDELDAAKRRLLEPDDRLGKAATDYVGLQKVMSAVAAIGFIVMFLFVAGQFAEQESRMDRTRIGLGNDSPARSTAVEDYQAAIEALDEQQRRSDEADKETDAGEARGSGEVD